MKKPKEDAEAITFRIKKKLKKRLIKRSKELGLTMTQYLIHLIVQDLQEKEFVEEVVKNGTTKTKNI